MRSTSIQEMAPKTATNLLPKSSLLAIQLDSDLLNRRSSSDLRTKFESDLSLGAGELVSLISVGNPSYVLRYDQLLARFSVAKDIRWIARDAVLDRGANLNIVLQDSARFGADRSSSSESTILNTQESLSYDPSAHGFNLDVIAMSGTSQRALAGRLISQVYLLQSTAWGKLLDNPKQGGHLIKTSPTQLRAGVMLANTILDVRLLPQLRNNVSGTVDLRASLTSRYNISDNTLWSELPTTVASSRPKLVLVNLNGRKSGK